MHRLIDFNSEKLETSCRITNTIIKYIEEQKKDVKEFIADLPYDEGYLTDTNNWIPSSVAAEIFRRLRVMFDDDEILYKIALASVRLRTLGFIDYTARLVGDPQFILKKIPSLNKYFTKTENIEIVKYGLSKATVKYYGKPGYELILDDCYYLRGTLAALPNIWGIGPAVVWEETCGIPIHKKGRINGKSYRVDRNNNVWEYDAKTKDDEPRIIGKLNQDGTFKLGNTLYGARYCIYHVSWSLLKTVLKKILYGIFTKPKILTEVMDEMRKENDIIQQKYEELYKSNLKLQRHYVETINTLIRAIDAKDHYTEDHSIKVSRIAEVVARGLKLPLKKIEDIKRACKLHDLGKIGVRESILLKPAKLTKEEWQEIKRHPVLGAEIIKPLSFLSEVTILIRQDHERWDGKGYPDGLRGEQIDIGARVIALSDAYDAMLSGRPYKKAMTKKEAIEEIKRNSGTQFDPKVVDVFLRIVAQL